MPNPDPIKLEPEPELGCTGTACLDTTRSCPLVCSVVSEGAPEPTQELHYLEAEFHGLTRSCPLIWDFVRDGSLDGVWYWDLEHPENAWISPEFWLSLGIDPATKRHDPSEWQSLVDECDLANCLDNFEKHCADQNHSYDQIIRFPHANGSIVWFRCRGMAIRDDKGKPVRMIGAHNDLTAQKRGEHELIKEKEAALAANTDLKAFAYSISHDLKGPANTLNLLLNELRLNLENTQDDESLEFVALCEQTTRRMRELIETVLEYTRNVDEPINFNMVDPSQIVEQVKVDLLRELQEHDGTLEIGPLPQISCCPQRFRVLIQNLLSNALKFRQSDKAPKIKIFSTGAVDGAPTISVQDNGIGIAKDKSERIFEMFARLNNYENYEGIGLGLALCKRIMVQHEGTIEVESQPGMGSTFTMTFPEHAVAEKVLVQ